MNATFRLSHSFLGVLALLAFVGCSKSTPPPAPLATSQHDHPEEGPHHGELIELSDGDYHAELVHDEDANAVVIYLLDGKAKDKVTSTEQELVLNLVVDGKPTQFTLAADPEPSDPKDESSKFQAASEELSKAIHASGTKGRLNVTIGGKPLVGSFEHKAHGHDHKH